MSIEADDHHGAAPRDQVDPSATASALRRRGGLILLLVGDLVAITVSVIVVGRLDIGGLTFAVLLIAANAQGGLYRSRLTVSILNDLPELVGRFLLAAGLTLIVVDALNPGTSVNAPLRAWVLGLAALVIVRAVNYALIRYLRAKRLIGKRTIIVGAGLLGKSIAHASMRERSCGLQPVGFVDTPPQGMVLDLPLPLLGPLESLADLIKDYQAEYVLVAYTHIPESELVTCIRGADRLPASIAVVPRLYELVPVRGPIDAISDIPLVALRRPAFRSPFWPLKRVIDIVASLLAIIVLSPLLLLLALIDRIVDGPHVIFRQERIGIHGQPFELYKFRSLRPADPNESETKWNIKNDDRVSWFGKFLRKSSLDELPQLFNILRGDMSLVGPRPERPHFAEVFAHEYPYYGSRHRVPCGLTGWAQIHGLRGDTTIAGRARYDNFYIENWSLWLDAKIILRTLSSLTRGSG